MADTFTRELFAWLNRVAADTAIAPNGFKLAFVIGQHINRKTGDAWPTQETLAAAIGTSVRTVRSLTDDLVARGHLTVTPGRGPHNPNRYRLAHHNRSVTSASEKHQTGNSLPLSDEDDDAKPEIHCTETGNPLPVKWGSQVPTEPSERTIDETSIGVERTSRRSRGSRIPDDWKPSRDDIEWAEMEGFDAETIQEQTERMRDYYLGNGRPMVRWSAAWRNWLRRSREFSSGVARTDRGAIHGALSYGARFR